MKTLERRQAILKLFAFFVMWAVQLSMWAWVWMSRYADDIMRPFGYKGNWLVFGVYGLLSLLFSRLYGGYQVGYYRSWELAVSGLVALFLTNGVTYLQTCLIGRAIMDFGPFAGLTLAQSTVVVLWAHLAGILYLSLFPPYDVLMVAGDSQVARELRRKMLPRSDRYRIRESVSADLGLAALTGKIARYQVVILCDLPAKTRNHLLKFCFGRSIQTYTTPKLSDILIRGGLDVTLFDTPLIVNRRHGLSPAQRALKRALDLAVSGLGLAALSPLLACIALAVKLHDGGPILFSQERCTIHNKTFRMRKFRSMVVDAEKDGGPSLAAEGDARITRVGKFLRAFRLDELPQLVNVLMGDMSLVGPRPERRAFIEEYCREIPEFAFRSKVKGGITGYAQVMGRYNTLPYDKLKMDLMYIINYSFWGDIKLILMTLKILMMRERSRGVQDSPGE